nr:SRPBCC family protein [Alicycliphilus sp.]
MSDLSLQLQQAASQLPVSSYFDAALLQRERELLFQQGPRYVGHAHAIPEPGDYYVLPQEKGGRALVRKPDGSIELLSNCCRHRQAIMLQGRGNLNTEGPGHAGGNIVCPIHRWTYSCSGELLGAPHFAEDPGLHLPNYALREWNGLLFEDNGRDIAADLAGMGVASELSFDGYVLDRTEMHECNYNWKTFIEVYLEDYHVGPFHPGLGNFVTCDDLQWQFAKDYSVQTVGVAPSFGKPGSAVYKKWHEVLLKYQGGELPRRGAIWLTYYPHIMVEWYP